jgi:hypothetical protein
MPQERRRKPPQASVTSKYPEDSLRALDELAEATGSSKAHHLREALQRHLEAHGRLDRRLWGFCQYQERIPVIISSIEQEQKASEDETASLPEAYALISLGDHLYPRRLDVYLDTDTAWERRVAPRGGFVVLGGPDKNRTARDLLKRWAALIPFGLEPAGPDRPDSDKKTDYVLVEPKTGERWVPDRPTGSREDRLPNDFADYGLVVEAPHPNGPGVCVLLAGCHAFGTHAAVRAMTDARSVATIARGLGPEHAYFAAVVEVRVRNFSPEPPAVLRLERISV